MRPFLTLPCSPSWLVDNPFRRRDMRPVLDRIGIRPGEHVLELGPGLRAFSVDSARRVEPEGQLIALVESAGFRFEERFGNLLV
jgi:hypothetical protein